MSVLRVKVPRKLKQLLLPKRYKGAYGGRGGAKSHFFAEQIILRCIMRPTRVVCIREVQSSIKDSVRQLLIDKINKLGVQAMFEVLDTEIRGPDGSLIVFKGMQSYNAMNIKSLEGYDIAWIEEAQTLTQHSLDLLRPTLRREGSELWFSWNPRFKTDPVDMFFRKNPPPDAISVLVNWRDNPWFPDVLRREMLHDFVVDEDKADHIWNGAYGNSQGAILAKFVNQAERSGRINDEIVYDPKGAPVEISGDLGYRDTASWWYWQRVPGGFNLLKYEGDTGLDADDWIPRLQTSVTELGATLGKIWLPHDARAKTFQSKHTTVERFLSAFGGSAIDVVPQSKKLDQISAASQIGKTWTRAKRSTMCGLITRDIKRLTGGCNGGSTERYRRSHHGEYDCEQNPWTDPYRADYRHWRGRHCAGLRQQRHSDDHAAYRRSDESGEQHIPADVSGLSAGALHRHHWHG
jgi:phage terminase large subunit